MLHRRSIIPISLAALLATSCTSSPDLESMLSALPPVAIEQDWHVGPDVYIAETGTWRFAGPLHGAFDKDRAMEMVKFVDQYYRAPANEGYDAVIDRLVDDLFAAGFGGDDARLTLDVIEDETSLAWTPVSAELTLLADGEEPRVLHGFSKPEGVDRVMLPVNAPSCSVEGNIALHLEDVKKGMILVTDVSASQVLRRAQSRGAAAVVSASLEDFNEDPSGQGRQLDAIQFRTLSAGNQMPVAQISRRSLEAIEEAVARAAVRKRPVLIRFNAEVVREERPLRTVVATIRGAKHPDRAVAVVSHVQEPGANDNASGVAGLLEGARALTTLLTKGDLEWPDSSLVFLWGDEFTQSETWLAKTDMTAIAGISSDMTGQKRDTGAIALLERMPDPGALFTLPPDAHTPWGAGQVDSENLSPNGFAVIARCALIDVGMIEGGNWASADHPWEGGSDHDVFIAKGIPAVLFWHFTDFTYHTSLDRIEFVDPSEIRRTCVAILSAAMAVADPEPADLDRYVKSLELEKVVRVEAARDVEDQGLEALWKMWSDGARNWLRKLCLDINEELPVTDEH